MTSAERCGECAFWTLDGERDGTCRRHAPRPTTVADRITHWPTTHDNDRCGEGVQRGAQTPPMVSCGECRFWHTNPGGGLDPQDRLDARREWWDHAGHCTRHAPAPSLEPGCRGFWTASHGSDSCAEGEPA